MYSQQRSGLNSHDCGPPPVQKMMCKSLYTINLSCRPLNLTFSYLALQVPGKITLEMNSEGLPNPSTASTTEQKSRPLRAVHYNASVISDAANHPPLDQTPFVGDSSCATGWDRTFLIPPSIRFSLVFLFFEIVDMPAMEHKYDFRGSDPYTGRSCPSKDSSYPSLNKNNQAHRNINI